MAGDDLLNPNPEQKPLPPSMATPRECRDGLPHLWASDSGWKQGEAGRWSRVSICTRCLARRDELVTA